MSRKFVSVATLCVGVLAGSAAQAWHVKGIRRTSSPKCVDDRAAKEIQPSSDFTEQCTLDACVIAKCGERRHDGGGSHRHHRPVELPVPGRGAAVSHVRSRHRLHIHLRPGNLPVARLTAR